MTAPSLLDELEEVVRLAEKATPGEWTATVGHDVKQQHGVTVMKAWAGRGPQQEHNAAYVVALVNWFRAHHAEIAAAERDAARWRVARNNTGNGLRLVRWNHDACEELQVMFPSPVLCDSDADAAIDAASQEGEG